MCVRNPVWQRVQDHGYPRLKPALNRVVNTGIRMLFQHGYNDTTNAFKAYRRNVIDQIQPLLLNHFNRTVEMPLKAIVRGYDFAVAPLTWTNGQYGTLKLRLAEAGSRYAFIVLDIWLEHHLRRGDHPTAARTFSEGQCRRGAGAEARRGAARRPPREHAP
jgi:dolichol-phosphate mannosyltransferase